MRLILTLSVLFLSPSVYSQFEKSEYFLRGTTSSAGSTAYGYVDGKNVEVGQPYLSNVKVTAEIKDTIKGEKISILRFRRRKHSMRKSGHRAKHSKVEIKNIKLESK